MNTDTCVIVGGGLAAAKTAEGLREGDFEGRIVLVGAELHLPYERPPLSKGYLCGTEELEQAFVHPQGWYDDHAVELRLATSVTGLDLDTHAVATDQGPIGFDRLLLATGSTPRRLQLADDSGASVAYLRTIEDSQRIKSTLRPGHSVTIVGGGWIGLEVAAAARTAGCEVAVLEALDLPLVRVLGPEVAEVFSNLHESHGVDLRTGVSVTGVERDGGRTVVRLADGSSLSADLLVVGVGVTPNTALAQAARLDTDNGIVVDEHLRTSHPDVFAAGDVANAFHPVLGRHLRVEHWDNAIEQGLTAARNMLGGGESYDRLPYFFTDQYDLGIEYVGNVGPDGYDEVVLRGDVTGQVFTAFWLNNGRVLAGMHINDWDSIDPIRRILAAGRVPASELRDSTVALEDLTS